MGSSDRRARRSERDRRKQMAAQAPPREQAPGAQPRLLAMHDCILHGAGLRARVEKLVLSASWARSLGTAVRRAEMTTNSKKRMGSLTSRHPGAARQGSGDAVKARVGNEPVTELTGSRVGQGCERHGQCRTEATASTPPSSP